MFTSLEAARALFYLDSNQNKTFLYGVVAWILMYNIRIMD